MVWTSSEQTRRALFQRAYYSGEMAISCYNLTIGAVKIVEAATFIKFSESDL